MCGVVGAYSYHYAAAELEREELLQIRDQMQNRGPDGAGAWWSENGRVALLHRRLSIIDLDSRAAQPMLSQDEKIVLSFNGEIYNYQEIREQLEISGYRFKSKSDTEVVLALYLRDGIEMLKHLRGMFAFVLWDENRKLMFLARDPYGIKPLFYADDGWTLRVASQVSALGVCKQVSNESDSAAQVGFYLWGSVPEPFTMLREIRAVPAGHFIQVDATGPHDPKPYWSMQDVLHVADKNKTTNFAQAFDQSIRAHLVSDVPVGLFLSSGLDSAAIALRLKKFGHEDTRSITLGFENFEGRTQDEMPLAKKIAEFCGFVHHQRRVSFAEFDSELASFKSKMDQPTIDGLNTWFVSKAAREIGIKVALSGLGGDELLRGYPSFQDIPKFMKWGKIVGYLPGIRAVVRKIVDALAQLANLSPKSSGVLVLAHQIAGAYLVRRGVFMPWELSKLLPKETVREGLRRLAWQKSTEALICDQVSISANISVLESSLYMRNQLLRDADWAGMAHGLEIRTPLVDAKLWEACAGSIKRDAISKKNLFDGLDYPIQKQLLARAKTGFTTPIDSWLMQSNQFDHWQQFPWLADKRQHWSRRYAVSTLSEWLN